MSQQDSHATRILMLTNVNTLPGQHPKPSNTAQICYTVFQFDFRCHPMNTPHASEQDQMLYCTSHWTYQNT